MGKYRRKLWASLLKISLKRISVRFILLLILPIPLSCVQNVDLELNKGGERVLVVESEFNNLNTGNYVKLTWMREVKDKEVVPVHDAVIIVSSDSGESDTLVMQEFNEYDPFEGYYFSEKLICKPGRTYALRVNVDGQIYEATGTMPRPPKIDSLHLQFVKYEVGKSDGVMPFIHFGEPASEKNYYMGKLCFVGYSGRSNPCPVASWYTGWGLLLLDDAFLPDYIHGININLPSKPKDNHIPSLSGDYLGVLYSVNSESFAYYQSLMDALKSDGGVYSPSPANHPTNIKSNHKVVGFFHVVSLDSYPFYVPRR